MFWQNTAPLLAKGPATSSASIADWVVNPCMPTLKLARPLHIIMIFDEVDFPLAGLTPQLASEYALSRNLPC